jgi:hypothetical protein
MKNSGKFINAIKKIRGFSKKDDEFQKPMNGLEIAYMKVPQIGK